MREKRDWTECNFSRLFAWWPQSLIILFLLICVLPKPWEAYLVFVGMGVGVLYGICHLINPGLYFHPKDPFFPKNTPPKHDRIDSSHN